MTENYSIQDIIDHADVLLEMMATREDSLYGAIDLVNQVRDELSHLNLKDEDPDE